MFNSNILDVAIGMIFIYLLLSLMCTAANEIIELMLKKRAIDLERGIRELLQPNTVSGSEGIVQKLYDHALINNLFGGTYEESRIGNRFRRIFRTRLPSYIPALNFALALMDLVALPPNATDSALPRSEIALEGAAPAAAPPVPPPAAGAPAAAPSAELNPQSGATGATVAQRAPLNAAQFVVNWPPPVGGGAPPPPAPPGPPPSPPGTDENALTPLRNAIEDNPLLADVSRRSLITLLDAAGGDVAKARENIENWYNSSMDRVSSWYKRRVQLTLLVLGVFVAIAVNVDTITIAKRLSTDKALRESLVNAADAYAKANASPTATPTSTPTPNASPAKVTSPSPSPSPSPSASPNASAGESPAESSASNSPSGSSASDSPGESESESSSESKSEAPTEPAECVKDAASKECKEARRKLACEDEDSDKCKLEDAVQEACERPDSVECKAAKNVQAACVEPDSDKCQLAKACTEPNSIECRQQKACQKDTNSPSCKYLTNEQQLLALGLPVGWDSPDDPQRKWPGTNFTKPGGWWDQLKWHWLGWLLTALAISLGAPFWFDLLNKFIVIRSAVKPQEKSPEKKSKD